MNQKIEQVIKEIEEAIWSGYSEELVKHAQEPKNVGKIEHPDGQGKIKGICGDTIEISIKIKDNKIIDAKFLTDGCGLSIACGSMVTELVKGKSINEALRVSPAEIIDNLDGLPEDGFHCSILACNTLHTAIANYLLFQRREGEE